MTVTTAALPPVTASPADQWYDNTNGYLRNECSATTAWHFGASTAGWTATHGSVGTSGGSPALLVTADGTGVSGWYATSPGVACAAGDTAAAQAQVYVPGTFDVPLNLGQVYVGLAWLNSSGGVISVTSGTAVPVNVDASATVTVTAPGGTAPSGTASVAVVVGDAEDSPAGTVLLASSASVAVWSPYQFGAAAVANAGVVILASTPETPSTDPGHCILYYKGGVLYAVGSSGTSVAIATT